MPRITLGAARYTNKIEATMDKKTATTPIKLRMGYLRVLNTELGLIKNSQGKGQRNITHTALG